MVHLHHRVLRGKNEQTIDTTVMDLKGILIEKSQSPKVTYCRIPLTF